MHNHNYDPNYRNPLSRPIGTVLLIIVLFILIVILQECNKYNALPDTPSPILTVLLLCP